MKRFLIKIARPVVIFKRKIGIFWSVLFSFLRSKTNNEYRFSVADAVLHLRERNWRLKPLELLAEAETNRQYRIDDLTFFWPKEFGTDDLPWIFAEIFEKPSNNPSSYCFDKAPLNPNDWVIDAGASEGFFIAYALTKTKGTVLAFEPVQELKSAMLTTFQKESEAGKVKIVSAGLGKEEGSMELVINTQHPCDASLVGSNDVSKRNIRITTLDNAIKEFDLSGHGFIKMDIEGAEMDALMGATETLRLLKPTLAVAVYHEYENAIKCREIIQEANPEYKVEFRGMNGYFKGKARPYLLFAY